MMDKKDAKKKRKPLNNTQISESSEKENVNSQTDTVNRSNLNELITIYLKPPRKNKDYDRLVQLRNVNYHMPEFYNRKRSISILTADDFMTDITNENDWHNMAETDRNALASALTENRDLHNRITELEDENIRLKALLDEARSLVEVLTELLEDEGEDSLDEKSDDSIWDEL